MNGICPLVEYNNMKLGIGLIGINEKELVVISVTNHYLCVFVSCDICVLCNLRFCDCRESCLAVKELLCFDQWNELSLKRKIAGASLPDCNNLASKSDNGSQCIDGRIFHKDTSQVTC